MAIVFTLLSKKQWAGSLCVLLGFPVLEVRKKFLFHRVLDPLCAATP